MKLGSLAVMACMLLASSAGAAAGESLSFGRFGRVAVVRPQGAPRDVVLFLSGEGGWAAGEQELARALAAKGTLVLGVDSFAYFTALGMDKRCGYPAGDLESLSQFAQKKFALPEYLHPVLVGQSSGAKLAYASLLQAPVGTFRGLVALGFAPEVRMAGRFCKGSGLERQRTADGRAERLLPVRELPAPVRLLVGAKDTVTPPERTRAFAEGMQGVTVEGVPGAGHVLSPAAPWKDALLEAEAEVLKLSEPPPPITTTQAPDGSALVDVSDLPLVEVPAQKEAGEALAVLLTGDGGWAGIDKEVAATLAAEGVPVVGLDSLRYFWKRRTPEETAGDLARLLAHYLPAWGKKRVVLVGYSRGADVLPSVVARLSPEQRQPVRSLALIAASQEAELEIHVMDLVGGGGGEPVLPEVKALGGLPLVCIYGSDEAGESLCPLLTDVPGAKSVMLKGGHHFGGDYAAVGRAILEPLREGHGL
ncbi:AcvB/VirJ family lysyl-phosphatidylglycerol hydrolase [Archangium sp.]|uniref:AcvB/VirJ family lysyl-phosphatidylglycerol hydrolase n=1 Tax=Archangium sp. TaxID=1872627 RepID=UPI00389A7F6B